MKYFQNHCLKLYPKDHAFCTNLYWNISSDVQIEILSTPRYINVSGDIGSKIIRKYMERDEVFKWKAKKEKWNDALRAESVQTAPRDEMHLLVGCCLG